ncbi:MAG TPA: hypothetical protein VGF21_02805 [Thermoleophilaceae bacterium]
MRKERLGALGAWALLGLLLAIIAVTLPELGSNPWPFRPGHVDPQGPLAPLVRAAGEEWDVGIARTGCLIAALFCGAAAMTLFSRRSWPGWAGVGVVLVVGLILLVPSTFLQLGLRDSTAPWFFTNDSTYQVEVGGKLLLDGDNPYGHDYSHSGLERFYTYNGSVSPGVIDREVALRHFAYFPGTILTAAVWRALPQPFDDYRLFILVCTLLLLAAALAFRAPLSWRLWIGALLVCNPIAVRSAWFGQTDAPSLLLLVLSFALVTRSRYGWAAASLAGAVLLKQFALVALPFMALMVVKRGAGRAELQRAALVFVAVLAVVILPFFLWDPAAFWRDTVKYGAGTYKIVGYGLSDILLRLHVIGSRTGAYPFVPIAIVLWLPLTIWLLFAQRKAEEVWVGAAAFSISILALMFIGRTFNNYYLVWPMTGAAVAALIAAGERKPVAS